MGKWTVMALRVVLAIALAGSLFVQCVLVPLAWRDGDGSRPDIAIPLTVIVVLGIATMQATAVCTWRLLTMVRRGTVFSQAAFRYVDLAIGAVAAAAVLTFGIAVVCARYNRTTPGDEIAPGLVAIICGLSLVAGGVALVVIVLRALLVQAVALDVHAHQLQSELDGVI